MIIVKPIDIDNKSLKKALKDFRKPKGKPYIFSIIFSLLLLISISLIIVFLIKKQYGYSIAFMLLSAFILILILSAYTKESDKNKVIYARYIEHKLREYAKENNLLPISPVIPLFLFVDDKAQEFKIFYKEDSIINCCYNDIKKYNIYYNKENRINGKLPSNPLKLIKSYRLEIVFSNNESSIIDFYNTYSKFRINNKIDFLQLINTKSINDLSTILDKIIKQNKKNK
ncbi:MAG: hypothetical protein ACI35S_06140 [Anaeroplasma sp.]